MHVEFILSRCVSHAASINLTHCYHICSMIVCMRCLLHHILSRFAHTFRENRDFAFIIIVQFVMSANCLIHFWVHIAFIYWCITPYHYRHCENLSEDIEFIKCLSAIFRRVRLNSQLSITQYRGLCVFSLPISPVMIEGICILCLIIIIKLEIWTNIHC